MLPKWGVVWQTKGFARDEASAPAAHILDNLLNVATILGWADRTQRVIVKHTPLCCA